MCAPRGTIDMTSCSFRSHFLTTEEFFAKDLATEFAMESQMGVHPNDVKRSPPLFTAIAKRNESLVRFMCSFMLKSALESSQVPVCQGIALRNNWTKPLTGARYGTKVRGRVVKCPRKY